MAVLEALASGTAVLLSPGCHFPEVEQAGAGRISGTDPGALVDALRHLLSDRSKLELMGQLGKRLVTERYTWDGVTDKLIEAYTEGLSRHKTALGKK